MTLEFAACLIALFFLAGIGTPIAYSILVASLLYLAVRGDSIGVEDEDGSAAEQLWARQRVLLAGRLFAQADSPSSLVELHKLVGAQIFRHVPYLLMVDPERDALEPAAEPGIGILVSSKTSDVARCLRSGRQAHWRRH